MMPEIKLDEILFDRMGQLKLATVIIGVVDLGLAAAGCHCGDSRDQAFLAIVIICFILSFFNIVAVVLGRFRPTISESQMKIDLIYHGMACLLLACVDIAFLVSVIKHGKGKLGERLFALIFGVINAAIYGFVPWRIWRSDPNVG